MVVTLQPFTDILLFPFFKYFLVSATTGPETGIKSSGPVDRLKSDVKLEGGHLE